MSDSTGRAHCIYALLLRLYPTSHRERFGSQMQQTFGDSYCDARRSSGGVGPGFWLRVVLDELRGIAREHLAAARSRSAPLGHWPYAALFLALAAFYFAPLWTNWYVLTLPVVFLAVLFLAVGGNVDRTAKFLVLGVALCAATIVTILVRYTGDTFDLLPPILLPLGLWFLSKSVAAICARSSGEAAEVWVREELVLGALAGLTMPAGLAVESLGIKTAPPFLPWLAISLLAPLLCAGAGFMRSRRMGSISSGIDAATGAALIGLLMAFLANSTLTVLTSSPPWPPKLDGGQQILPMLLWWWVFAGVVGAVAASVAPVVTQAGDLLE